MNWFQSTFSASSPPSVMSSATSSSSRRRHRPDRVDQFQLLYTGRHRSVVSSVVIGAVETRHQRNSLTRILNSRTATCTYLLAMRTNLTRFLHQVDSEIALRLVAMHESGVIEQPEFPPVLRDHIIANNWYEGWFAQNDPEFMRTDDIHTLVVQLMTALLLSTD